MSVFERCNAVQISPTAGSAARIGLSRLHERKTDVSQGLHRHYSGSSSFRIVEQRRRDHIRSENLQGGREGHP